MLFVSVACVALVLTARTSALPGGASTCDPTPTAVAEMSRPQRATAGGALALAVAGGAPYEADAAVQITLTGAHCGILVTASRADDGRRVGSFDEVTGVQHKACAGAMGATVTHTADFGSRTSTTLTWNPGAANHGPVVFKGAVLLGERGESNRASQEFVFVEVEVASARGARPMPPPVALGACAEPPTLPAGVVCADAQPGVVDYAEWAGRAMTDGAAVTVAADEIVVVRQSPGVRLGKVDVLGQLVLAPDADAAVEVHAESIYVRKCGRLFAGTRECPIAADRRLELVLFGTPAPEVSPEGFGTKVLAGLPGSQIDIHGAPVAFAWSVLDGHAQPGVREVQLAGEAVGWRTGQKIVLASTSHAPDGQQREVHDEVRTITAIDGRTVRFDDPLEFFHYGSVHQPAGAPASDAIDMRGEVALLTRNVRIVGDTSDGESQAVGWGGHIMVLGAAQLRVQDVELAQMGQANELARYPIHFHVTRANPASYAVRNSIHDTFQRCITVHGTDELLVQGNAAYKNAGHCYFVEDGDERDNVFDRNLGISPQPHTLLGSDSDPAVFWVTNPTNHYYRNHAVGGAFGFWYAMPLHPTGAAQNADTEHLNWSRYAPMGDHRDNVAHSSRSCVFIDRGLKADGSNADEPTSYTPLDLSRANSRAALEARAAQVGAINEYEVQNYGDRLIAPLLNITVYKCSQFGIWTRGSGAVVSGARIADCLVGCSQPQGGQVTQDSVFIGETDNEPDDAPLFYFRDALIIGYQSYDTGIADMLVKSRFYNFRDRTDGFASTEQFNWLGERKAGAVSGQTGPNTLPPFNFLLGNTFVNVDNKLLYQRNTLAEGGVLVDLRDFDISTKGVVHYDHDGTLTGTCGNALIGSSPLMRDTAAACVERPDMHAWECNTDNLVHVGFHAPGVALIEQDVLTLERLGAEPAREDFRGFPFGGVSYPCPGGAGQCKAVNPRWNTNVLSGHTYLVSLENEVSPGEPSRTPKAIDLEAVPTRRGEWVRFALRAVAKPSAVAVNGDQPAAEAASAAELSAAKPWFFDAAQSLVVLHLEQSSGFRELNDVANTYELSLQKVRLTVTFGCTGAAATADAVGQSTLCATPAGAALTPPVAAAASIGGVERCGLLSKEHFFEPATPAAVADVFVDAAGGGWLLNNGAGIVGVEIDATAGRGGSAGIACTWPEAGTETPAGVQLLWFTRASGAPLDRAPFTHLQFDVRAAPDHGSQNKLLVATLRGADFDTTIGTVVHPNDVRFSNSGFVSQEWTTYTIPFDALDDTSTLTQSIIIIHGEQVGTKLFFDNVRFVTGTTSERPIPGWPIQVSLPEPRADFATLELPPGTVAVGTTTTSMASTTTSATSTPASTTSMFDSTTLDTNDVDSERTPMVETDKPETLAECMALVLDKCTELCVHGVRTCSCSSTGEFEIDCMDASDSDSAPMVDVPDAASSMRVAFTALVVAIVCLWM